MAEFHDMVQCENCGVFHVPETTITGRFKPHCINVLVLGPPHQWMPVSMYQTDLASIERRALGQLLDKKV